MDPRSLPALAQKLVDSLRDPRLRIEVGGGQGADLRAPGQGAAIVFETNQSSVAIPEYRNQDGLTRTVHYSRIRPKSQALGELIAIFVVPDSEPTPEP